jgi:hypothetical protein
MFASRWFWWLGLRRLISRGPALGPIAWLLGGIAIQAGTARMAPKPFSCGTPGEAGISILRV